MSHKQSAASNWRAQPEEEAACLFAQTLLLAVKTTDCSLWQFASARFLA